MYRMAIPVIGYRESPKQASRSPAKAAAIRNNRVLRSSYVDLFNALVQTVSLNVDSRPLDKVAETVRIGLREQLALFRQINRLHYSSIIQQNRIHFVLSLFPDGEPEESGTTSR